MQTFVARSLIAIPPLQFTQDALAVGSETLRRPRPRPSAIAGGGPDEALDPAHRVDARFRFAHIDLEKEPLVPLSRRNFELLLTGVHLRAKLGGGRNIGNTHPRRWKRPTVIAHVSLTPDISLRERSKRRDSREVHANRPLLAN